MIAINQDELGVPGELVYVQGQTRVRRRAAWGGCGRRKPGGGRPASRVPSSAHRLRVAPARARPSAPQIYAGPLAGGARAVVLLDLHHTGGQYLTANATVRWATIGLPPGTRAAVRDLYAERDLGVFEGAVTVEVQAHDVVALRVTPVGGLEGDTWRPWDQSIYGGGNDGQAAAAAVAGASREGQRQAAVLRAPRKLALGSGPRAAEAATV